MIVYAQTVSVQRRGTRSVGGLDMKNLPRVGRTRSTHDDDDDGDAWTRVDDDDNFAWTTTTSRAMSTTTAARTNDDDGDSARRRLSWRACVESDDEENDASTTTATRGKVGGTSRSGDVVRGAVRPRAVLGDVDVNAGRIIDASPRARGKSRATTTTTTNTNANTNTNTSPRAYLAGSTPGVTSAKHASRVRALVIDEDEEEETEEEEENAEDADAALFAFESGAWDAPPAASGDDDTTDSTVVLTPGSAATTDARRASRSVSETLAVFKSLAHLAASPSEEEARVRRAAPTPANTPATTATNEPAVDLRVVSPIIGVRRHRDEGAWNATMERIVDALDVRDEDEDDAAATERRPSRRYKMARASAVAAVMLQVAVRLFVVVTTSFARASSNDSLGRRCVIEGGAFALSWWFGAKVNWDSLSSTSYASYGGLMNAQKHALRLQRALRRDEAFRSALDVVGRASALFAYGSAVLGVLASVVKIAHFLDESSKKKRPSTSRSHKKNVLFPSMNTPVGCVLATKASSASRRAVETPTTDFFRGANSLLDAPTVYSLSPLIV